MGLFSGKSGWDYLVVRVGGGVPVHWVTIFDM